MFDDKTVDIHIHCQTSRPTLEKGLYAIFRYATWSCSIVMKSLSSLCLPKFSFQLCSCTIYLYTGKPFSSVGDS